MSVIVRFPPQLRKVDADFLNRLTRDEAPVARVDLGMQHLVNLDAYRGGRTQHDDDPLPPAGAMALAA